LRALVHSEAFLSAEKYTVGWKIASSFPARLGYAQRLAKRFIRFMVSRYAEARKWMRSPSSRQSRYGLDCLNFTIGSIQTSFGTFVAFYLADLGWTKESVGLALATCQIAGVLGQIPGSTVRLQPERPLRRRRRTRSKLPCRSPAGASRRRASRRVPARLGAGLGRQCRLANESLP